MTYKCPKCGSRYVDNMAKEYTPSGTTQNMKCLNCGHTWGVITYWDNYPDGEWLMSCDTGNDQECVKFFKMPNGYISMWLFDRTIHAEGEMTEVVYGKHAFLVHSYDEITQIVFDPPKNAKIIKAWMNVAAIEFNPDLEKKALQNEAMRLLYRTEHNGRIRFSVDTNNTAVLNDIASLLRSITGGLDSDPDYSSGGCYIATAVYGSYDCPEVWTLRRFRDYTLSKYKAGRIFIKTYYAVSPAIVRLFGKNRLFTMCFNKLLNGFVKRLNQKGYSSDPYSDN